MHGANIVVSGISPASTRAVTPSVASASRPAIPSLASPAIPCVTRPAFPRAVKPALGLLAGLLAATLPLAPSAAGNTSPSAMQRIETAEGSAFWIDTTEVSIAQYRRFQDATGYRSLAEREGGGFEWGAGWTRRPGWTWHSPYGKPGSDDEPAVHLNWSEARQYCQWVGRRLPTDAEWMRAAYTETRERPPDGFVRHERYPYPTGHSPEGANHRDAPGATGRHFPVGRSKAGVNGLYDMGANVWEWVDSGPGSEQVTRGGSWWYGPAPMHHDHRALKPADFYVVYIGWRCAADRRPAVAATGKGQP